MSKPLIKPLIFFICKSLKQNYFSATLSILAVSLSVLLILLVNGLYENSKSAFLLDHLNLNAVVGARSSGTQLVMNSFYHMDVSPGNIPYKYYQSLKKDKRIELAIPYALGDNYYGYRVIGTEESIFAIQMLKNGQLQFSEGNKFNETKLEVVFGSQAANHLKIKLNDEINSFHGVVYNADLKHNQTFKVVGILKPTQTPLDQVILIPLDAFYRTDGHVLRNEGEIIESKENEAIKDEYKEISSIMLKINNPLSVFDFKREINQFGNTATFAFLPEIVPEILDKVGWGVLVLKYVSYLVIFIAGIVILVGIYNSLSQRLGEFAILRALGASRLFIFFRIIGEAEALVFIGLNVGAILYIGIFSLLQNYFYQMTGLYLTLNEIPSLYYWLPCLLLGVGFFAGLIPAIKIYRTDVNKIL
jgi:putative ABC transport system permease protein